MENEFIVPEVSESSGNYFKLKWEGSKKIRIISNWGVGFEIWKDKKPKRSKDLATLPQQWDPDTYGKPTIPREFWAIGIYNITDKKLELWTCNLITVRRAIQELSKNPDRGNPTGYDLTITKKKNGDKTDYIVTPSPLVKLADEEQEVIDWHWFDWSELYVDDRKVISEKESKF